MGAAEVASKGIAQNAPGSLVSWELSRRSFLGWSIATAVGIGSARWLLSAVGPERVRLHWVSPRGTLAVIDDYPIWTALGLGYMKELGVELSMSSGEVEMSKPPTTPARQPISFPSPASLVTGIDRGVPLKSVFQLVSGSIFGFALRKDGRQRRPQDLKDAVIAVGSESWRQIVDPLLVEAGVDPVTTRTEVAGPDWLKAVSLGKADAALSWRGLERNSDGRRLRHMVGESWSQLPANVYAVESDSEFQLNEVDGMTRFLRGVVMGLEFAQENPRAAAQITYRSAPGLASAMSPQAAVDVLGTVASTYSAGRKRGLPWGFHEESRWRRYLAAATASGLVKPIDPAQVYTNRLIDGANSFDISAVRLNAATFELDREFRHTTNPRRG